MLAPSGFGCMASVPSDAAHDRESRGTAHIPSRSSSARKDLLDLYGEMSGEATNGCTAHLGAGG